jgi:hypothetical protein
MEDIKRWAARDASSINQFIIVALAEKIAALKARATPEDLTALYFDDRAARGDAAGFARILAKAGRPVAIPGDELPEGWLPQGDASVPLPPLPPRE